MGSGLASPGNSILPHAESLNPPVATALKQLASAAETLEYTDGFTIRAKYKRCPSLFRWMMDPVSLLQRIGPSTRVFMDRTKAGCDSIPM